MTGITRAARWAAGALAGLSVRDLAGALAVVLIVVAALCWVLADEDRSRRLTGIRGARLRPAGQQAGKAAWRQHRRRTGAGPGPPGGGAPPAG